MPYVPRFVVRRRTYRRKMLVAGSALAGVVGAAVLLQFDVSRSDGYPSVPNRARAVYGSERPSPVRDNSVLVERGDAAQGRRGRTLASTAPPDGRRQTGRAEGVGHPSVEAETIPVRRDPDQQRSRAVETATSDVPAEIKNLLYRWRDTFKDGDASAQADCYAPQVQPFFTKARVSRDEVRREKERVLSRYRTFGTYDISDIKLESLDGDEAVVTLRKEWAAVGGRPFSGAEHQRLTLARVRGEWKIAGEEELKVYWVKRR